MANLRHSIESVFVFLFFQILMTIWQQLEHSFISRKQIKPKHSLFHYQLHNFSRSMNEYVTNICIFSIVVYAMRNLNPLRNLFMNCAVTSRFGGGIASKLWDFTDVLRSRQADSGTDTILLSLSQAVASYEFKRNQRMKTKK